MDETIKTNIARTLIQSADELIANRIIRFYPANEHRSIPDEAVEVLTEAYVQLIAEVTQVYIDAGSEREVTLENDALRDAIWTELNGWSESTRIKEEQ